MKKNYCVAATAQTKLQMKPLPPGEGHYASIPRGRRRHYESARGIHRLLAPFPPAVVAIIVQAGDIQSVAHKETAIEQGIDCGLHQLFGVLIEFPENSGPEEHGLFN